MISQWFKTNGCLGFCPQLFLKLSIGRGKRNNNVRFWDNFFFILKFFKLLEFTSKLSIIPELKIGHT